jgi:hypothetical protein
MRVYQAILLVVFLTIGMISAGIAWERFYVSPRIEEDQQKPDSRNIVSDELPAECLEELSMRMGQPSKTAESLVSVKATPEGPSRGDGAVRPGNGANQVATHIEVEEPSPSLMPNDAVARPLQKARSAEYDELMVQSAADLRHGRPRAAPGSPENAPRRIGAEDAPKSDDALELMRRLRSDDSDQRAEARRSLVRRGFSEVDLELARRLLSPDAETRVQLAREVQRLSSVDAARWLMWLAQDPDTEVRLAAISTLATTGDPSLLERVEALARNDRDPQIKALADQIRKQHDLEANRGGGGER